MLIEALLEKGVEVRADGDLAKIPGTGRPRPTISAASSWT